MPLLIDAGSLAYFSCVISSIIIALSNSFIFNLQAYLKDTGKSEFPGKQNNVYTSLDFKIWPLKRITHLKLNINK